jgi:hypothetical protein
MRPTIALLTLMILPLAGCYKQDRHEENADDAARKAGRAAYEASHDAEKAAKELGRKLDEAGKQAQKGWDDAKHQNQEDKTQKAREKREPQ